MATKHPVESSTNERTTHDLSTLALAARTGGVCVMKHKFKLLPVTYQPLCKWYCERCGAKVETARANLVYSPIPGGAGGYWISYPDGHGVMLHKEELRPCGVLR